MEKPAQPSTTVVMWLRRLAVMEGATLLGLLLVTMPMKYMLGWTKPNLWLGFGHGLLFVGYLAVLLYAWWSRRWPLRVLLWGMAASVVPVLPFWVERRIFSTLR